MINRWTEKNVLGTEVETETEGAASFAAFDVAAEPLLDTEIEPT